MSPRKRHDGLEHGLSRVRPSSLGFKVVPAKGLTLVEVGYPPDEQLAARAEQTRARRDAPGAEG